jgi:hypothetical protein
MKQKKYNGFQKIDNLVAAFGKEKKLEEALDRYKVLRLWDHVVEGFFKEAKNQTKAMDFKKGRLLVACLSEELAYKIKVLSQRIIYALNSALKKNKVFALEIQF